MKIPFRKDDQEAVMNAVGPIVPALLREAVDEGFYNHGRSRERDPEGFVDYGDCSRSNMLYDRIAAVARELVTLAASEQAGLSWTIGSNKRSTEISLDPYLMFRLKRAKENRAGKSASVRTRRQLWILADTILPVGQMVLGFAGEFFFPAENRIWLTVVFDLDELEEAVTRVSIGVETKRKFLWKLPLLPAREDIIASFPATVANRIVEMRSRRSA